MYGLTQAPDWVSWPSGHGPVVLAPTTSALAVSALSLSDQLALLIWFWSIQLVQFFDSVGLKLPFPEASQVPYSVTKTATPRLMAVLALSRSHWVWVPA